MAEQFNSTLREGFSFIITDKDGVIQDVNEGVTIMTGYSREEVIGKTPRIFKSGHNGHEFYKKMWATLTSGEIWRGEMQNKRKDGSLFWEKAIIVPQKDNAGNISNYVALKEDITDTKDLDLKFQAIVNSSPDLIFILDLDGKFLEYYPENIEGSHYAPQNFIGRTMRDIFPNHSLSDVYYMSQKTLMETNRPQTFEYSLPYDKEVFFYEARIARLNGTRIVCVVRDVTGRKKLEVLEGLSSNVNRLIESTNQIVKDNPALFHRG
jgi:PAS domain S-box-containing protein